MVTVFATKNLYESALEKFRLRLSSGLFLFFLLFFFFPSLLPIDRTVTVTADKNLGEQAFPKYLNMPSRIIETLALSLSLARSIRRARSSALLEEEKFVVSSIVTTLCNGQKAPVRVFLFRLKSRSNWIRFSPRESIYRVLREVSKI